MKPMLLNTKLQKIESKRFAQVLICSIVTVVLSSCAGLKKFPAKYVYEVDLGNKVCGQYEITAYRPKLQFKHANDLSLNSCNGVFGFSTSDMPKVLDWADAAADAAEKKCSK